MANPQDFPKALAISMVFEFCLFTIAGAVVYFYAGTAYTTAPAYGSLISKYGKVAAGFTLPTIVSRARDSCQPHTAHRREG